MSRLLADRAARPFVAMTAVGVLLIVGGQVLGVISPLVYGAGVAMCLIGTTAARASVSEAAAAATAAELEPELIDVPLLTVKVWHLLGGLAALAALAAAAVAFTG